MKDFLQLTSIEEVFPESKFQQFRAFCKRKEIINISDLTNEHLEEHYSWKSASRDKKIKETQQRLFNQIINKETEKVIIVEDVGLENRNELPDLPENSIEITFEETSINTFPKFCEKNMTQTVNELINMDFQNYSNMNDIGVRKVEVVKQKVTKSLCMKKKAIVETDENQKQGTLKSGKESTSGHIIEVFSENRFRTFRRYCELNNIQTFFDITDKHLNGYGDMRGVGVGKVKDVKQHVSLYRKSFEKNTELIFMGITASSYEINTIFHEKKFNLFKEFCARNGFKTLRDIKAEQLEEFAKFKLVGKKKIEEVHTVLSHYTESGDPQLTFFESGEIYEFIKDLEVQKLLCLYGYNSSSQSRLKIKDIEGENLAELKVEFDPYLLYDLFNRLKNQKHPKDILSRLRTMFLERDLKVLQHRFGLGETLEEVGSYLGVTRERIRQIANKLVTKSSAYLKRERFSKIIRVMTNSNYFVTRQELIKIVGTEYEWLINMLKHESLIFKYYKKIDIFFFDDGRKIDFSVIEDFIKDLPDVFNLCEYQQQFEEVFESIGIDNPSLELIQTVIGTQKYTKYGEIYSRRKLTESVALTYLFKHYVNEPLRIDEAGVAHLQALASRHLDYELGRSVRSVDARIRDAKSLLQVDRLTFEYFDSLKFDPTLILEIDYYLNQEFNKRKIINVEDVFERFEGKLKKIEVYNKIHLYSLIKYYLEEKFIIGQGNTLNIFKKEKSMLSVEKQLISFMK